MKKLLKFLTSRLFTFGVLILAQVVFFLIGVFILSKYYAFVASFLWIVSIVVVVLLVSKPINPSVKISWIIVVMVSPLFGGILYVLFGKSRRLPKARVRQNAINVIIKNYYPKETKSLYKLQNEHPHIAGQSQYIFNTTGMPVYENTSCEFYPLGEKAFHSMKTQLQQAEHFIFLEYFIIDEGKMWNAILAILEQKAQQGVDVRLLYDDVGCFRTLPANYHSVLEKKGIHCAVFNPVRPAVATILHNRDHRKIMIIDGHTGFTGGINLADEYINAFEKYGHWKDCAVMLKGEAVQTLTLMFLEIWGHYHKAETDYTGFLLPQDFYAIESRGFVQPYDDSPFDNELIAELVYLNIINQSVNYVYIMTPYFIVDNEMITALRLAAKRGVDIRMITPHIPDKKIIHEVTRSYYPQLLEAGITLYEYTPGFVHSKMFVSDNLLATVGTVNLDYRSLYHHYECGVWLYKTDCIADIRTDFLETIPLCKEITLHDVQNTTIPTKLIRAFAKIFAPLM